MPPRKSNVSAISATGDEGTPVKEKERDGVNVEDLALPKTMVQRLAKGVLPSNTRIEKDAITAMSKSATVFVNYLSSGANDRTLASNRKTISPANVLEALADLEFASFIPRVEAELQKFNEIQTGKRNEYRRKLKEGPKDGETPLSGPGSGRGRKKGVGAGVEASMGLEDDEEGQMDGGEERASKRVRRESGDGNANGREPDRQLLEGGRRDAGVGLEEGDTAVDAAIEAADAALREEDDGEEEDEEEEDDSESSLEMSPPDSPNTLAMDARLEALQMGLDDEEDANTMDEDDADDDDGNDDEEGEGEDTD